MKIAAKLSMTALVTVLSVGAVHYAMAQAGGEGAAQQVAAAAKDAAPIVTDKAAPGPDFSGGAPQPIATAASAPAAGAVAAPLAAQPVAAPAQAPNDDKSVKEVLDSIKVPGSSPGLASTKAGQEEEEDEHATDMPKVDPKIPSSVKNAVKKLNSGSDNVTIDDLNSAREAIVKLDVLIDIEKRLADLAQIRKEREEKLNDLSGSLPSSALGGAGIPVPGGIAPPSLAPSVPAAGMPAPTSPVPMPMPIMGGGDVSFEVVRITGASGNYVASIKENGSDTPKNIHVGDKLSDGSEVTSISRNGVTVKMADKKTKTIQVKDVNTVFSGR